MKKVIIDTNFLLIPEKFKIDIFYEISRLVPNSEIIITKGTFRELEQIKKNRKAANVAIKILDKYKDRYKIYEGGEDCKTVDDEVLRIATDERFIVCTDDKELKRKLRERNVGIITLKHKSKIDFE